MSSSAALTRATDLLTVINAQSFSVFSLNQSAKNDARNKQHPHLECLQLKTTRTTVSTSSSCAGKSYVPIETRTYTGPLKTILHRGSKTQVSTVNATKIVAITGEKV